MMKKEYNTPVVEVVEGNELEGIFCIGSGNGDSDDMAPVEGADELE